MTQNFFLVLNVNSIPKESLNIQFSQRKHRDWELEYQRKCYVNRPTQKATTFQKTLFWTWHGT